jgi:branched-subunit amino acid ABC-type transport system permease component
MTELLPYIVTGLVTGSLYSMAGLGLVLTYRTSGVLNFGHGTIAAGGAFVFYTLHEENGWSWPLAAVVTLALFALVGGPVLELITRSLTDAPAAVGVIVTVGIFLAVDGFLLVHYGDMPKQASQFLPTDGFTVSGVLITYGQLISAAVALVGAIGLYRFLKLSRLGMFMRAVVDTPSLVALAGQNPIRVRRASWMIGSAFAPGGASCSPRRSGWTRRC